VPRATTWEEVVFTPLPVQEGEGQQQVVVDENPLDRAVPDPFSLVTDVDLKQIQATHQAEGLFVFVMYDSCFR
jgi:hypothetical protein